MFFLASCGCDETAKSNTIFPIKLLKQDLHNYSEFSIFYRCEGTIYWQAVFSMGVDLGPCLLVKTFVIFALNCISPNVG